MLREGISAAQLRRDVLAGFVVGVVALPLAIAFAIASGLPPERGLYTAVFAGFVISALSGSRVQVGGPTGAFILLVSQVVTEFGVEGLALATMMAGGLLLCMGLARLGRVIQYIPYPVTVGFTAGIAVVIATSQIRDALGLPLNSLPAEFFPKWIALLGALPGVNAWALLLCLSTVGLLLGLPRWLPRVPASMVALLVTTSAAALFQLPVETIGSRFGALPRGLPMPSLPGIDWEMLPRLVSPAFSIALLAAIESLLSAVVADGMTGRRHRSNAELLAQGVANIVSPLFGGMPATGAIARTATNVRNGGRTPIAGLVHAATVALVLLVAGRWAAMIPMATLAGILFVVAWNMSELHLVGRILRGTTRGDALVLLSTFALTVIVDLSVAIQVGVVLAAVLFMRRMIEMADARVLDENGEEISSAEAEALRDLPPEIRVYEINGPFFFGAAHKVAGRLAGMERAPRVLILRTRNVPMLDATGLRVLETLQRQAEHGGPLLLLSGLHSQPRALLEKSGLAARIGASNLIPDLGAALARAREVIADLNPEHSAT